LRMVSKISKPRRGKCFSIIGKMPSRPVEEDLRDKMALLGSMRENGPES